MFIDLIDILRCPRPHEQVWLVASSTSMDSRHIMEGELGCHVCEAHYPIHAGVADFGSWENERHLARSSAPPADSAALRLAALLGLTEPGGIVLLVGDSGGLAHPLAMLVGDTQLLVVNPAERIGIADNVSALTTSAALPLANGACRAAAIDATHASPDFLNEVTRVLRSGARLVAPATVSLPDGIAELARDQSEWVGEQRGDRRPIVPITLSRQK